MTDLINLFITLFTFSGNQTLVSNLNFYKHIQKYLNISVNNQFTVYNNKIFCTQSLDAFVASINASSDKSFSDEADIIALTGLNAFKISSKCTITLAF